MSKFAMAITKGAYCSQEGKKIETEKNGVISIRHNVYMAVMVYSEVAA